MQSAHLQAVGVSPDEGPHLKAELLIESTGPLTEGALKIYITQAPLVDGSLVVEKTTVSDNCCQADKCNLNPDRNMMTPGLTLHVMQRYRGKGLAVKPYMALELVKKE
jgi:hypothetical protein